MSQKAKAVVVRGDQTTDKLRWDDLIEMNKEVKETLLKIVDELDNLINELGDEVENNDKLKNMINGIKKEIDDRHKEIQQAEAIHTKEIEVDENGKKVKKKAFFSGEVIQDPNDKDYNAKLFEAYLIAMNLYANILTKLLSNFNIGRIVSLANVNIKRDEGEVDGTKQQEQQ